MTDTHPIHIDPHSRFAKRRESLTADRASAALARQVGYMSAWRLACDMATNAMRRRWKYAPRLVPLFGREDGGVLADTLDGLIVWNEQTRAHVVRVLKQEDADSLFAAMEVTA